GGEAGGAALGRGQALRSRAAADSAELGACCVRPAGSSELIERFDSRFDRLASCTLKSRPPTNDSEREERPCPAERVANALMTGDCFRQQGLSGPELPARGGDESAAAGRLGEHPFAAQPARVRLPAAENTNGILDQPQLKQRLDVVASPPAHPRLGPLRLCRRLLRRREALDRRRRVSAPLIHE